MAFSHGSKAKIYAGGIDLSPYGNAVGSDGQADLAEVTVFGNTSKNFIPGLISASYSFAGLYDPAADAALKAALGTDPTQFAHLPYGDALGNQGYANDTIATRYSDSSDVGDASKITAEFTSKSGFDAIKVLQPLASQTVTGQQTSLDNAASSANGGVGYLQVSAITSNPTVTIKVQHSVDNSVWVDLITFAGVTAAPGAQRIAVAGTINRYLRAQWTFAGGTSPALSFWLAFARK